jgi:hypothetical protein
MIGAAAGKITPEPVVEGEERRDPPGFPSLSSNSRGRNALIGRERAITSGR